MSIAEYVHKSDVITEAQDKLDELPDTLHELLRVALRDLRKTVQKRQVDGVKARPHMLAWINRWGTGRMCEVCLAGACIGNRLNLHKISDGSFSLHPVDFPGQVRRKMYALDHLRGGGVYDAVASFYGHSSSRVRNWPKDLDRMIDVPMFISDRRRYPAWHKAMLKLARLLKKHNL